jgi:hypothetical protein
MAYEMQGISALDPRVAATEQFISEKQIPPEQVPAFLMQMGADPKLAGLVFKYQRLKQAAGQQQEPAPTSTVAQDVDQQYAQMQGGLGGLPAPVMENAQFQGGIAPDQEAPPQMMAGGGIVAFSDGGEPELAALQQQRNDAYKSGDPAAIAEANKAIADYFAGVRRARREKITGIGRYVREAADEDAIEAARRDLGLGKYASYGQIPANVPQATSIAPSTPTNAPPQGTIMPDSQGPSFDAAIGKAREGVDQDIPEAPAAPQSLGVAPPEFIQTNISPLRERMESARAAVPKSIEEAEAAALKREEGFGETKAIEARRARLDELEKKVTTSPEKKFWLAFAQAGFAASAKGARDLWETLSMGGVEGIKAYQSMKDKEQEALEKLEDKRLQLDSMSANIKRMASKTGREEFRALEKAAVDAENNYISVKTAVDTAANTRAGQVWQVQRNEQFQRDQLNQQSIEKALDRELEKELGMGRIAALDRQTRATIKQRAIADFTEAVQELRFNEAFTKLSPEEQRAQIQALRQGIVDEAISDFLGGGQGATNYVGFRRVEE